VGTRFTVVGHQSSEFVFGRVATRYAVSTPQAATVMAEGVGYPQDLRNCAACHRDAPEEGATVTSISRRTCSGCHPDVWYGAVSAPSDLDPFHLPHSGGPQADDSACRDCHVESRAGGPTRWVPIAEAHVAPARSPRFKKPRFALVDVQDLRPGTPGTPGPANAVVKFKAWDAVGTLTPLNAPVPTWDNDPDPASRSVVPRKLTSLTIRIGGPNTDFLTGGGTETIGGTAAAPTYTRAFSYTAACTTSILTLTATADPVHGDVFTCTFPNPFANMNLTAGKVEVQGYWTIGIEGRRASSAAALEPPVATTDPWYAWSLGYDVATDSFRWPFTGEAVTEGAENVFVSVDTATGTIASDPSVARRVVVEKDRCNACHLRLAFHGGTRTDPQQCLFCHAPDATDWMYRPRDLRVPLGTVATGQVLLWDPLEYPASSTKAWTYATADGIEERSISLKTMIHRIHTGEREGAASLEGIRPFVIHAGASRPAFLDDVRYPNDLANCEVCHRPGSWRIEAVPATAAPTTANERATILHTGTAATLAKPAHTSSSELKVLAVTSACLTCHTNGAAKEHAAANTVMGVEQCITCHGEAGAQSVRAVHAVP
jgi:OmcA/MtrC family decaheme c-type cytochrome